ncbi:mitochondrial carrier protein-like protein [Bisporella sp. PMI_857]|nr:mitochondrial carrier protein-like protein [Bisporella sp. PMI_857]
MGEKHKRTSDLVEAIGGLSAGTISTLVVHPLDVIKTRLQIHRNTTSSPISGFGILRGLLRNPKPVQSLYRGLTPNLVGNASSWAIFFYFKSIIENQLLQLHNRPRGRDHVAGSLPHQDALSPTDYFLAAGISGVMITLSTSPIWVLKTRMLSSDKGSEGAYENMWQGARHIWKTDGVKGFYRGGAVSLLGVSHGAVQFAVYEPLKAVWKRYIDTHGMSRIGDGKEEKMSTFATLTISSCAKIAAGTVTYPYQVLRSRLQTYHAEERFGKGITGVARNVYRENGWRGFYRGLGTNIVRVLPATWVTFLVYENVRYYLPRWGIDRHSNEMIE